MAWEGWYALWELTHWVLPLMFPRMHESRRREVAERAIRRGLDEQLLFLRRFHFTKERWQEVSPADVDGVLSDDYYWQRGDVGSWQVQFVTTQEGNQVCPGPPRTKDGWTSTTWWIPKSHCALRAPTSAWIRRHIRRYVDGLQTVYDFYWPLPAINRYYASQPEDPLDRVRVFCSGADGGFWSCIRRGGGDDERLYRSQVGEWLGAFRMSTSEWRQHIRGRTHPVRFSNLWMDEDWP